MSVRSRATTMVARSLVLCGVMAAMPVAAQQEEQGGLAAATVTVDGTAERQVTPDEVVFVSAVETQAMTLEAARTEAGVAEDRIQTERVQANRVYEWNQRQREFKGFSVSRTIHVISEDLDRFDQLLGVMLETTEVELRGTRFSLTDRQAVELEVRAEAMASARARGEALAAAAGRSLGEVLQIVNSSSPPSRPGPIPLNVARAEMSSAASDDSGPITSPGDITVATSVQVTYRLE